MKTIYIEDDNSPIIIESHSGDSVQVEYAESESSWFDVQWDGEHLRMIRRRQHGIQLFQFDFYYPNLFLSIPQDFDGTLQIRTKNGSVSAENVHADTLTLSVTNGEIRIEGGTSRILKAAGSNGKIILSEFAAAESLSAVTSNGNIAIDRLQCPDILLRTRNGSIKGTVSGKEDDYSISFTTVNGSGRRHTDAGKSKKISADTLNGSISVSFTE